MSNKYKTVTVFESVVKAVKESRLSDAEKGRFYSAYMEYFLYGTEPVLKGHGKVIFELIKPSVDMNIRRQKNNENYYHNKAMKNKKFSTESVLNQNLNQSDFSNENDTDSCSHARRDREIKKETTSLKKVSLRDEEAEAKKSSWIPDKIPAEDIRIVQAVEKLAAAYPKRFAMEAGKRSALKVLKRLIDGSESLKEAETRLLEVVKNYAVFYRDVPDSKKRYTWSMEKFFEAGHYDDDPALWNLSNDENDNETLDVFRRLDERK